MAVACGTLIIGAHALPAGRAHGDVRSPLWHVARRRPKLDSYIIQDHNDGNRTALTASMVALYDDGKLIAACDNSPTRRSTALRDTGRSARKCRSVWIPWATHYSTANELSFASAEAPPRSTKTSSLIVWRLLAVEVVSKGLSLNTRGEGK